ncbi:MAG: hypothetical protein M1837_003221 [Sclerophora amabilis]|nr:MAG: hypothetical protein M1837_003221 [Sclerophora amabilis]
MTAILQPNPLETKLPNGVTAYDEQTTTEALVQVINSQPQSARVKDSVKESHPHGYDDEYANINAVQSLVQQGQIVSLNSKSQDGAAADGSGLSDVADNDNEGGDGEESTADEDDEDEDFFDKMDARNAKNTSNAKSSTLKLSHGSQNSNFSVVVHTRKPSQLKNIPPPQTVVVVPGKDQKEAQQERVEAHRRLINDLITMQKPMTQDLAIAYTERIASVFTTHGLLFFREMLSAYRSSQSLNSLETRLDTPSMVGPFQEQVDLEFQDVLRQIVRVEAETKGNVFAIYQARVNTLQTYTAFEKTVETHDIDYYKSIGYKIGRGQDVRALTWRHLTRLSRPDLNEESDQWRKLRFRMRNIHQLGRCYDILVGIFGRGVLAMLPGHWTNKSSDCEPDDLREMLADAVLVELAFPQTPPERQKTFSIREEFDLLMV